MTGSLAAIAAVPGCTDRIAGGNGVGTENGRLAQPDLPEGSADHPQTGTRIPEMGLVGRFLNPDQLAIVTAMAARIIPGDEDDPGAVEAGAVDYIDLLLTTHEGYPQRTYTGGPMAQTYEGDEPPEPEDGVIWVQEDELGRYGWQSIRTPREIYQMGLARLEELAQQRHGTAFVDLGDDEQDELLEAVEDAEDDDVDEIFEPIGGETFFGLVKDHVVQGFLADPMYGGNRDRVGWDHIGFPGAQRAYSPQEMLDPDFARPSQSLAQLPMLHGTHADLAALGAVRRRHPAGPID